MSASIIWRINEYLIDVIFATVIDTLLIITKSPVTFYEIP